MTLRASHATVLCIQGNCIDRSDTAGCNGKGVREGVSYTLNTIDHHAVCFAPKTCNCTAYEESDVSATLITGYHYGGGGDGALIMERVVWPDKARALCARHDSGPCVDRGLNVICLKEHEGRKLL